MNTQPLKVDGNEKLHWLRRLDYARSWEFLDDQRRCSCCGETFSGRQVRLVGGTRPLGPLRLLCPTRRCPATAADWVYLHEPAAISSSDSPFGRARILQDKGKSHALPVFLLRFAILRAGFRFLGHVGVVT